MLAHSIGGWGRGVPVQGRVKFVLNRHARDVCRASDLLSEETRYLSVIEVMSMLGGTGIDWG